MTSASSRPHKAAVYIGRFQPFHSGHLALVRRALAEGETAIIVLGSSFQARSPKNPFTWSERATMIRLSVPTEDRDRLHFVPVRDYYDDAHWVEAVRSGVAGAVGETRDVALVGHFKDASSYYLDRFPGWTLVSCERAGDVDATNLRDVLFTTGAKSRETAAALLAEHMPQGAATYVEGWTNLPYFSQLVREYAKLKKEKQAWAPAPYAPTFITVDAVVTCAGKVLLIERDRAPGEGLLALPGGFLEQNERLLQGAIRELREETGLGMLEPYLLNAFQGVAVFDHPERSLRGRTVTHAHHFALKGNTPPAVEGQDDARAAHWVDIASLVGMEERFFEDHFHILNFFLKLTDGLGR